ncbi:MAG TPA: hypothetical protein VK213_07975 [Bacteroidales bacterium]|nr:hypothetical protein [Bacteroidales bacterium]
MNENKVIQQVSAVFSVFMVFFYFGVGIFFIFYSDRSTIDKPVRVILGSTFLLYGVYRAVRAYTKLVEAFSRNSNNNRDDIRSGRYK